MDDTTRDATRALVAATLEHVVSLSKAISSGDYLRSFHAHHQVVVTGLQLQAMTSETRMGPWVGSEPPGHVINRVMGEGELQYFVENLMSPCSVRHGNTLLQRLLEWVSFLVEEIGETLGPDALPTLATSILRDLESTLEKNSLRNFRAVTGTTRVFRSTMPGQYAGTPALRAWLEINNITTIIDLRRPEEIEAVPNHAVITELPGITNVHVNFNSPPDATTPPVHDYVRGLITRKAEIARVFETILASPGGSLIHCVAGKDRTGILSALVQLLVGVPETEIVEEYIRSGHESVPSRIKLTLGRVHEEGGIEAFLESCGFSREKQARFRARVTT